MLCIAPSVVHLDFPLGEETVDQAECLEAAIHLRCLVEFRLMHYGSVYRLMVLEMIRRENTYGGSFRTLPNSFTMDFGMSGLYLMVFKLVHPNVSVCKYCYSPIHRKLIRTGASL